VPTDDTSRFTKCDFLLVFYIDLTRSLHRFRDYCRRSHFPVPHVSTILDHRYYDYEGRLPPYANFQFYCTVQSQSTNVTDRQTDRQTDVTLAAHIARRAKNGYGNRLFT